ncbi:MAG: SDR family oxidoreductase [Planctomycetes bacterium]|nr:SDR family oxidoreductase [Planctomycetota bacterium]
MTRALVVGGTGVVGAAVLRVLRARGVDATFTYLRTHARAEALAAETGHRPVALDLADAAAVTALVRGLFEGDAAPAVAVLCAGVLEPTPALDLDDAAWDRAQAVNARGPFVACRELARGMAARGGGDIVVVGALDRGQSLPIPVAFAAAQGLLGALVMALAREVGPRGVRVNLLALGLLDQGLSLGLPGAARADYLEYSALRRFGTPAEAAASIAWLALDNRYMTGKVLAVNGGI